MQARSIDKLRETRRDEQEIPDSYFLLHLGKPRVNGK